LKRIVCLLTLAICGCAAHKSANDGSPTPRPQPAVEVQTAVPQRRNVDKTIDLPADVRPRRTAGVYAKVSGSLKELRVDIGDRVQKDQVLAVLDSPELGHEVQAAQAQVLKAQRDAAALQSQVDAQSSQTLAAGADIQKANAQLSQAQAVVSEARARYLYARESYQRLKTVYEEDHGLIARQQLDKANSDMKVAAQQVLASRQEESAARGQMRAQRQRAGAARYQVSALAQQRQSALEGYQASRQEALKAQDMEAYATLRAPFAGVVTRRFLDVGTLIQSSAQSSQGTNQPIVEIVDDSVVTVSIRVPELESPQVKPGRSLELTCEALPGEKFKGRITRISQALSSTTDRSMVAESDLPNTSHHLQPGMFGHCLLTLATHKSALAVPTSAIVDEKGKTSVYLAQSGKAVKRAVKIGFQNPRWSEITEGLNGTDTVVIKGKENLSEGAPLKIKF
jgi:HlyD family secretion protein